MTTRFALVRYLRRFGALSLTAATLGCTGETLSATHVVTTAATPSSISRTLLLRQDLPNLPGWETRLYLIEYPPGVAAPLHHHPVEGLGYVVSGSFESAFQGEAPVSVHAGQSFVERALVPHTLFRNADATRPLKFVMAFVVARDAPVVVTP